MRKQLAVPFLGLIALVVFVILSGCSSAIWNRYPPPRPSTTGVVVGAAGGAAIGSLSGAPSMGAAIGGVWGGVIGHIIEGKSSPAEQLQYNGVQVIHVGDDVKLVLPSDRFFYPNSPNLKPSYYPVLTSVACYLRCFRKVNVEIAAYTDNCGSWHRNLALTKMQALNISNYLWNVGIDVRVIYTIGYGPAFPIASNNSERGRALNRRVEITLRRIEDPINEMIYRQAHDQ